MTQLDPPQDCDAPFCGCNPEWTKVIEELRKLGWQSRDDVRELERERDVLKIKANASLANNLCSDHFDKQVGKPCLACAIDSLNGTIVEHDLLLSACCKERNAAQKRVAELESVVYVPGVWRCPKCQFSLMRTTLNVVTGTASADDTTGEKCPNCQSPLWRVTERDAGNDLVDRVAQLIEKLQQESGDAERYRWLRAQSFENFEHHAGELPFVLHQPDGEDTILSGNALDGQIDAAMRLTSETKA